MSIKLSVCPTITKCATRLHLGTLFLLDNTQRDCAVSSIIYIASRHWFTKDKTAGDTEFAEESENLSLFSPALPASSAV